MKKLMLAMILVSGAAMAQEGHEGAPAATPAPAAPVAKKMDKKAARAECMKEGVKGKELRKCIKSKLK